MYFIKRDSLLILQSGLTLILLDLDIHAVLFFKSSNWVAVSDYIAILVFHWLIIVIFLFYGTSIQKLGFLEAAFIHFGHD